LRTHGNAGAALDQLRSSGLAGQDAFAVGATIAIPLRERSAPGTIAEIERTGVRTAAVTTREPTLDDVYLRLTGGELTAAA
jgi:hypothetical protein